MKFAIYGAASLYIDKKYLDACEDLGKVLAKRGHSLVYGAGSSGVMGAVSNGFKANGGFIHGVIPNFFKENGYESIDEKINKITYTEDMAERKKIMEDECDAFIICPGGIGTYEEFFQTLTLKQLGRHNKAIVVYDLFGYYKPLKDLFANTVEQRFTSPYTMDLFKIIEDRDEMIEYLENYVPENRDNFLVKRGKM